MFRMLQTLEREPQEDLSNQIYDASPAPGRQPFVSIVHNHSILHLHNIDILGICMKELVQNAIFFYKMTAMRS